MKMIYMVAADVLRALGWEVVINDEKRYYNLVLTNTSSSEDMPESHKSCLRGLLRGWLMEFNYEGGHQQVNIYKEVHGLDPEDDRYSCLDACVNRTDGNTPVHELDDKEIFVRRKDRFDRYVLAVPISENISTGDLLESYEKEIDSLNDKIHKQKVLIGVLNQEINKTHQETKSGKMHVYIFLKDSGKLITDLWTCHVPDVGESMVIWQDNEHKRYKTTGRIYGANAEEKVGVWNIYVVPSNEMVL